MCLVSPSGEVVYRISEHLDFSVLAYSVSVETALITCVDSARCINDPWAYETDDTEERRRLFQCYMYIVLNDDPEANHYSLPAPFSPVFDAITKELL
jgi:primary-amine oxidase